MENIDINNMDDDCCSTNNQHKIHEHGAHEHEHSETKESLLKTFLPSIFSFFVLIIALGLEHYWKPTWFSNNMALLVYIMAYIPVGLPVLKNAFGSIRKWDVFSEFFLMSIATIGAFAIGEYAEGVTVMLFYSIGELFQSFAVKKAKKNIKTLLDQRPDEVTILVNNQATIIKAPLAKIGDLVQLKSGEKLALDGKLISQNASFNTAALTGESKPDTKSKGDIVLAGMINLNAVIQVEVTTPYEDSKLSKILELVQHATTQKAPTELFIRKFAKIYTPIVVYLALGICLIPYFFVEIYLFSDWLYRALIFLVISIPLGYFGGIGAASKNGILFKGSTFLDSVSTIQHVVIDKTGTMTEGVFKVQELVFTGAIDQDKILQMVNVLESKSTHPVATAIHHYVGDLDSTIILNDVEEISGHGLKAEIEKKVLLVGNFRLMDKFNIVYDVNPSSIVHTVIAIAFDNQFAGYLTIADKIKADAQQTIKKLNDLKVNVTMLSGDKDSIVQFVASTLGIEQAFGDLLPEDKVNKVQAIKKLNQSVAFVGDGVNDAPVIALSDVGIAMGGLGSDATIETADIIIQDDQPSKIPMAINIGKQTKRIVWQNIVLAFGVKAIVLLLGAVGLATMWEAVFADVGVALLAVLNAVRIQNMKF